MHNKSENERSFGDPFPTTSEMSIFVVTRLNLIMAISNQEMRKKNKNQDSISTTTPPSSLSLPRSLILFVAFMKT